MIEYRNTAEGLEPEQLRGFFEGWPAPPTPETHLSILDRSDAVVIAVSTSGESVAGFITALTDGILAAYIPLLEVRPQFRGQGIGRQLVENMLKQLGGLYMVDVICDARVQGFYNGLGFTSSVGASVRRYEHQGGSLPLRR